VLRFRVRVVGAGRARLAVAADPGAALTSVSCAPRARVARPGTVPAADVEPLGETVPSNELLLYRNVPADSKVKQVAANLARTAALGGGAARPFTRSELLTGRHSARGAEVCRLGRGSGEHEVDVRVTVPGSASSVVLAAVARVQGDGGPVMAMRTTTARVDAAQARERPVASGASTSGDLPGTAKAPADEDAIQGVVADPGGSNRGAANQSANGRADTSQRGGAQEDAAQGDSGRADTIPGGGSQSGAGQGDSGQGGAERDDRGGAERGGSAGRDADRGGAGEGTGRGRDGRDGLGEAGGVRSGAVRSPEGAGVGRWFGGVRPRAGSAAATQGLLSQDQGLPSREASAPEMPSLAVGGSSVPGGGPLGAPASGGPVPGGTSQNPVLSGGVPVGTSTGMRESGALAVGGSANGESGSNGLTSPNGVMLPAVEMAAESPGRPLPLAATVAGRRLDNSPRPNPLDGPKSLPFVAGGVAILLLVLWPVARRQRGRIQRRSKSSF
jgi:hypothetical protein